MATNQVDTRSTAAAQPAAGFTFSDIAQAIVMPLASLRLTVGLLFVAVLMTWVASLEQAKDDAFFVKMRHFDSVLVEVPVQTFFPPSFAPSMQNVPGKLFLPSGATILVLMLVNLTAAHSLRFKIQASGVRLIAGVVALGAAVGVTGLVIANGHGSGVQTETAEFYAKMWIGMQIALLVMGIGSIVWSFFLTTKGGLERGLLLYLGGMGVLAALVLLVLGEKTYIGDSAMRIMWQLAQATLAAVAGFIACVFLFKRKAGMVLLHVGIMGLMLNELWVTSGHKEMFLTVVEGESSNIVSDIRFHEMAIIDVSDPEVDRVVTVPAQKLARQEVISSEELPFDVRCLRYFRNSDFNTGKSPADNLATTGIGLRIALVEKKPVPGTGNTQEVNAPAAYVELFDKQSGNSLGTHALTSQLKPDLADRVTVDGKDYYILLRPETLHKPYKVTLDDAIREDYPGSTTPKYFGSEVRINDSSTNEETSQRIFMNNPLRYEGETFYQAQMSDPKSPTQFSTFQVVTNVGWMIPYVCCMFTVVGLLGQFVQSLLAYLNKQVQTSNRKSVPVAQLADPLVEKNSVTIENQMLEPQRLEQHDKPTSSFVLHWLPALIIVGLLAVWPMLKLSMSTKQVVHNEMRLDLLGAVPVTYEGRVQPLDSFARNTLRQLCHHETVANPVAKPDDDDKSLPAIAWLADGMFGAEVFKDYPTFYMTDPNVKDALKLPSPKRVKIGRKQYVYTVGEVLDREKEVRGLIPDPALVPDEDWTPTQKRMNSLRVSMLQVKSAQFIFGPPERQSLADYAEDLLALRSTTLIPFVVASNDPEKPWKSMIEGMGPAWITSIAGDSKTLDAVAEKIAEESWEPEDLARIGMLRFAATPEFRDLVGAEGAENAIQAISTPEGLRAVVADMPETEKGIMINLGKRFRAQQLLPMLQEINDGNEEVASADSIPANVALLMKLKPAYLAGDAKTFNQTLETYLASINKTPPTFYSSTANWVERVYNAFSPFYIATVMYIASLLFVLICWVGVAWRGWRISVGRIAIGLLLLGLSVHTIGIVMRVAISGRPPVTNLYSSVVFVTAAGIVIALLMESFTRMSVGTMLGAISGFGGLLWAYSMTVVDGDTFTVMVAVLDTTFWLATHVIMISLGYAATFMAGLVGLVYLLGYVFTPAFSDKKTDRLFSNMLYGIVCFGLLASFFGTVLGGLWGDDSWGRFWGWDPKENGALMIVLWNALILHARWGGLVKARGVAGLALLGNVIVLWSWKGVNLLGVGLHAYAASEDQSIIWIVLVGVLHVAAACFALLPANFRIFGEWWVKSAQEKI